MVVSAWVIPMRNAPAGRLQRKSVVLPEISKVATPDSWNRRLLYFLVSMQFLFRCDFLIFFDSPRCDEVGCSHGLSRKDLLAVDLITDPRCPAPASHFQNLQHENISLRMASCSTRIFDAFFCCPPYCNCRPCLGPYILHFCFSVGWWRSFQAIQSTHDCNYEV